jgi:2-dehydropantoate 2-reductase
VVAALDELPAEERFDVVLVTVKTSDLAAVLPGCAAHCVEGGAVLLGQNGVDVEAQAAARVPAAQLCGAVLLISASVAEPGVVVNAGMARIIVGAAAPAGDAASRHAAERLSAVGVQASHTPDLPAARWTKLVWNNAWNVLTCLTGLPVASAARLPSLRALARAAMIETVAVARAEGVPLGDHIVDMCLQQGDLIGETRTSMLQDRLAGRPLEAHALCGTIVERGRARGVATPVNDVLYPLLLGVSQAVAPGRAPG